MAQALHCRREIPNTHDHPTFKRFRSIFLQRSIRIFSQHYFVSNFNFSTFLLPIEIEAQLLTWVLSRLKTNTYLTFSCYAIILTQSFTFSDQSFCKKNSLNIRTSIKFLVFRFQLKLNPNFYHLTILLSTKTTHFFTCYAIIPILSVLIFMLQKIFSIIFATSPCFLVRLVQCV